MTDPECEESLICSICGGLHPAGHRDKELEDKLEAVKTHLTKWISQHSDWQMGRMNDWKDELVKILGCQSMEEKEASTL